MPRSGPEPEWPAGKKIQSKVCHQPAGDKNAGRHGHGGHPYRKATGMMDVLPAGTNMIATDVTTPFFVPMKVTMMVAFVLALPNTLYQIWAFIAPGSTATKSA